MTAGVTPILLQVPGASEPMRPTSGPQAEVPRLATRPGLPALKGWVGVMWAGVTVDDLPGEAASRKRVLPTGHMHLVFRLAGPRLSLYASAADATGRTVGYCVVGGARDVAYLRALDRDAWSVGVELRPGAARALLGVPADILAGAHWCLGREEFRMREQQQLDRLSERLRRDLAVLALQGAQTGAAGVQTLSVGEGLLEQLESSEAVGRLVIDLLRVMANEPGGTQDIVLRNGDRLLVPESGGHGHRRSAERDIPSVCGRSGARRLRSGRAAVTPTRQTRTEHTSCVQTAAYWPNRAVRGSANRPARSGRVIQSSCRSMPARCGRCRCGRQ